MPRKLRRAISAVKDQASIGLAKVSRHPAGSSTDLEVAVLKATSHDEIPIDDRHADEVVLLAVSSPASASALVHALSRRLSRTRNWVVALKALLLTHRALKDAGPYFPREAFAYGYRSGRLLDLSSFRDDSARSSPWDYTAFVRTFALYLDAHLESFLLGKIPHCQNQRPGCAGGGGTARVSDMKPPAILDRMDHWQRLLDRAIGTRPTGPARHNRLVQISLYSVVHESIDLYHSISDGLTVLLDNFFNLQYSACVDAFHFCCRAAKQFDELESFYGSCKSIGVGRASEYPAVQRISSELLNNLRDFLREHQNSSSSPNSKPRSPPKLLLPAPVRCLSEDLTADVSRALRLELPASDQAWPPVGKAFLASSSSCNDIDDRVVSDKRILDEEWRAFKAQSLEGWELVLVESANKSNDDDEQKQTPVEEEACWDQASGIRLPKNKNNPFQDSEVRSLVVMPRSRKLKEDRALLDWRPPRAAKPREEPISRLVKPNEERKELPAPRLPKPIEDRASGGSRNLRAAMSAAERKLAPADSQSTTEETEFSSAFRSVRSNGEMGHPMTAFQAAAKAAEERAPPPEPTFRVVKPGEEIQPLKPSEQRAAAPSFQAVKLRPPPREETAPTFRANEEIDLFASPFHGQSASGSVQASEAAMQQKLILEQQRWIQQQNKIIANKHDLMDI